MRQLLLCLLVVWSTVALMAASSPAKSRKSSGRTAVAASRSSAHKGVHTSSVRTRSGKSRPGKKVSKSRGQQSPEADRVREIQTALIREHYLAGDATGDWNQQTRDALAKYQKDNGWQTKLIPDSRALIKLGLGPSREGLLNPDTAAISAPHLAGSTPQPGGAAN